MIAFDPDRDHDPLWPDFSGLTDDQYAALWERFALSDAPEEELRAFADACFRAGQAQCYQDGAVHIRFRGEREEGEG